MHRADAPVHPGWYAVRCRERRPVSSGLPEIHTGDGRVLSLPNSKASSTGHLSPAARISRAMLTGWPSGV
jgi:hypothetical protein